MATLEEQVGSARWLWGLGHVDSTTEQTLLLLGHAHPKVKKCEITVNQRTRPMEITYTVWITARDFKRYKLYRQWMDYWWDAKTLVGKIIRNWSLETLGLSWLWDFDYVLYRSVADFLGPETPVVVEVRRWEG